MTTKNTTKYCEESVRTAAYYNWKNAGCPCGKDEYFWNMALNQLYGSCSCSSTSTSSSCCSSKSSSKSSSSHKTAGTASSKSSTSTKKASSK